MLKTYSLRDFMHITLFATIATVSKTPLSAASNFFAGTFGLPGGIISGMYYMFWIIAAYAVVGKRGTATLFCLIQALLSLYLSNFPAIKTITFLPPGLVVDLFYWVMGDRAYCKTCMILGGAMANIAGALAMAVLFLKIPVQGLIITALISSLSGGLGGYLAYIVVKQLAVLVRDINVDLK
ncbi:MAG: ECF transporter S component [Bacillota bacterium]|nr:ECF transporter S component [Bacillota bacterium]